MTTDDELRERLEALFLDEVDEHVERLERGLEVLVRSHPEPDPRIVDEMFRSAHNLKGAAQALGFSTIASVCHHLEDVLAHLRDGSLVADERLLRGLGEVTEAVSRLGQGLRSGGEPTSVDISSLVSRLVGAAPRTARSPDRKSEPSVASEPQAAPRGDPSGPPPVAVARSSSPSHGGTVRVARDKLDALLAQAGDLVTSSRRSELLVTQLVATARRTGADSLEAQRDQDLINAVLESAAADDHRLREALDRTRVRTGTLEHLARSAATHQRALHGLATSFAAATRAARTVPFADATSGLNRLVRDLAHQLAKEAELFIHAADVEIDKDLVASLHHALVHLVRNAVDHGIEAPEERLIAGKSGIGRVEIDVTMRSDGIQVEVADDGRGVQLNKVRQAAGRLGLRRDDTGEMSLAGMLFQPGLSTATHVSSVSGRGVGLDAVRSEVESTGGTVTVESMPGEGTTFRLLLPLTQSTFRAVLARCSGEVVTVPAASIDCVREFQPERARLSDRPVVFVDGAAVPLVSLSQLLGWASPASLREHRQRPGLLVTGIEGTVVLAVDELLGEREIVLRPPPERLTGMSMMLGTTQLEDGSVSMVLSPSACVRVALSTAYDDDDQPNAQQIRGRVLLVEDSITTRELQRRLLESAGHTVVVAVDGEQAWRLLEEDEFDVVVSDVRMPRMGGLELCNAIRGSRRLKDLPVVLLTSLHSETDRQKGLAAGADAYLSKSSDRAQLVDVVERFL